MQLEFTTPIMILLIAIAVSMFVALFFNLMVRKAEKAFTRKQLDDILKKAEGDGWFYNQASMKWENRYEPMRFTTDGLISYIAEQFHITPTTVIR